MEELKREDIKLSKRISKLLRHDAYPLSIDEAGWMLVEPLLNHLSISQDKLDDIVKDNNKQRFEYNNDKSRIRARQGHSVQVDLGYEAVKPPLYLYHGTIESARIVIQREGLKKMGRQHVHLSPDVETAKIVAKRRGKPVILQISAKAMYSDGYKFYHTENNVWLCDEVPVKYIKKINKNDDIFISTSRVPTKHSKNILVDREKFKKLLKSASSMLASFAAMGKQRPQEDYEAIFPEDDIFLEIIEELTDEEMEAIKRHNNDEK